MTKLPTFNVVVIKQLIAPVGKWELVFDCSPDEAIIETEDVIYFAVCDVLAFSCDSPHTKSEDDCFYGVVLPVARGDDGDSLIPVLTEEWVTFSEQKVILRKLPS